MELPCSVLIIRIKIYKISEVIYLQTDENDFSLWWIYFKMPAECSSRLRYVFKVHSFSLCLHFVHSILKLKWIAEFYCNMNGKHFFCRESRRQICSAKIFCLDQWIFVIWALKKKITASVVSSVFLSLFDVCHKFVEVI